MRCLACDVVLTEREATRKYEDAERISNPEEQYIGLCTHCIQDTGLTYTENPNAPEAKSIYEEEDSDEIFHVPADDSDW